VASGAGLPVGPFRVYRLPVPDSKGNLG